MIRVLALGLLLCAGCSPEERPVLVEKKRTSSALMAGISEVYRDSIHAEFLVLPSSILRRMQPGASAEDVRIATVLLEVAEGESKLRYAHYLTQQAGRSVPPLLSLIGRSQDWNTLVAALQILGKVGDPSTIEGVAGHLSASEVWVRMAAAHALGDIGGVSASRFLRTALSDTADNVVSAALIALGKGGNPASLHACLDALTHPNPRVRAAAVSAIGRLGAGEELRVLERLLDDPDSGVRHKARQALKQGGAP